MEMSAYCQIPCRLRSGMGKISRQALGIEGKRGAHSTPLNCCHYMLLSPSRYITNRFLMTKPSTLAVSSSTMTR